MATLSGFVAERLPSYGSVYRALGVVSLVTLLSTFFVVPLYTLSTPDETQELTMLDDLSSNIRYLQTVPPPLKPIFYAFLSFALAGILAHLAKGFLGFQERRANWFNFIAAVLAAVAADQTAIHVRRNNHPDVLDAGKDIAAADGGLSVVALVLPAVLLCADAYGINIGKLPSS
jgi:hypothetical protein